MAIKLDVNYGISREWQRGFSPKLGWTCRASLVQATTRVLANSSLARRGISNSWLRTLLVEAAHAASHTKNTYFSTQYHRLAARRGKKKAMIAVGDRQPHITATESL